MLVGREQVGGIRFHVELVIARGTRREFAAARTSARAVVSPANHRQTSHYAGESA